MLWGGSGSSHLMVSVKGSPRAALTIIPLNLRFTLQEPYKCRSSVCFGAYSKTCKLTHSSQGTCVAGGGWPQAQGRAPVSTFRTQVPPQRLPPLCKLPPSNLHPLNKGQPLPQAGTPEAVPASQPLAAA